MSSCIRQQERQVSGEGKNVRDAVFEAKSVEEEGCLLRYQIPLEFLPSFYSHHCFFSWCLLKLRRISSLILQQIQSESFFFCSDISSLMTGSLSFSFSLFSLRLFFQWKSTPFQWNARGDIQSVKETMNQREVRATEYQEMRRNDFPFYWFHDNDNEPFCSLTHVTLNLEEKDRDSLWGCRRRSRGRHKLLCFVSKQLTIGMFHVFL